MAKRAQYRLCAVRRVGRVQQGGGGGRPAWQPSPPPPLPQLVVLLARLQSVAQCAPGGPSAPTAHCTCPEGMTTTSGATNDCTGSGLRGAAPLLLPASAAPAGGIGVGVHLSGGARPAAQACHEGQAGRLGARLQARRRLAPRPARPAQRCTHPRRRLLRLATASCPCVAGTGRRLCPAWTAPAAGLLV